jgi:probable HAF family extracellular repeat protein
VITGGTLGTVSAMGMNEATDVVGAANYPLDAFRWSDGEFEALPDLPGHVDHIAHDINDTGTVVGIAGRFAEENYPRAVRWVDGVPEDLGVLEPTGASEAYGVNDAGMVVGQASVGFGWRAFVWTEDTGMFAITNGIIGTAYDVNESGQVTGDSASSAFVWEDGELTSLEHAAGYAYSFGNAINDAGQIAGYVKVSGGLRTERFARWTPDGQVQVLGGAGSFNRMYGINNDGTAVGRGVIGAGGGVRSLV